MRYKSIQQAEAVLLAVCKVAVNDYVREEADGQDMISRKRLERASERVVGIIERMLDKRGGVPEEEQERDDYPSGALLRRSLCVCCRLWAPPVRIRPWTS